MTQQATAEKNEREAGEANAAPGKAPAGSSSPVAALFWTFVLAVPVVWYLITPGASVKDVLFLAGRLVSSVVAVPIMILSGQLDPSDALRWVFPGHF